MEFVVAMEENFEPTLRDSSSSERKSLEEFKQNVLGNLNSNLSDDSLSTLDPETCKSVLCAEYEDPFEGVFYRTVKAYTQISIMFLVTSFL